MEKALVLHMADTGLIPGISDGPSVLPEIIPDCRVGSDN